MMERKIRVKVSGVKGIRDPEGNIGYKIGGKRETADGDDDAP